MAIYPQLSYGHMTTTNQRQTEKNGYLLQLWLYGNSWVMELKIKLPSKLRRGRYNLNCCIW